MVLAPADPTIATAARTAPRTIHGARRPHLLRVRSDAAPTSGWTATAAREDSVITNARLVTLLPSSIVATCAGTRTPPMPLYPACTAALSSSSDHSSRRGGLTAA